MSGNPTDNLTPADRTLACDAFLAFARSRALMRLIENAPSVEDAAKRLREWWFDLDLHDLDRYSRRQPLALPAPGGEMFVWWNNISVGFGRVRGRRGAVGWKRGGTVTWLQVAQRARLGVVLTGPGPEAEPETEGTQGVLL